MISTENTGQKIILIKEVIKSLPSRKSESFEAELCYPGFLVWNRFLTESYTRENVNNLDTLTKFMFTMEIGFKRLVQIILNFKNFGKLS